MTLTQRNRIMRAINKYVRAYDADSWKGGGDPADIPMIEQRLKNARARLVRVMDEATDKGPGAQHDH